MQALEKIKEMFFKLALEEKSKFFEKKVPQFKEIKSLRGGQATYAARTLLGSVYEIIYLNESDLKKWAEWHFECLGANYFQKFSKRLLKIYPDAKIESFSNGVVYLDKNRALRLEAVPAGGKNKQVFHYRIVVKKC